MEILLDDLCPASEQYTVEEVCLVSVTSVCRNGEVNSVLAVAVLTWSQFRVSDEPPMNYMLIDKSSPLFFALRSFM